ncbi:MAG: sigma-70 family RNA polymerase sigma factor [Proteobacteria bacterium]|nr:sigma-70 family RNA polymerase sigma factor [Pseudomonadota bacterium]
MNSDEDGPKSGIGVLDTDKQMCEDRLGIDRQALVVSQLKFVVQIIKRYYLSNIKENSFLMFEDLFQDGCIGLIRAAMAYQPEIGPFSTYAYYWIRQSISRAICETDALIRIPVHRWDNITRYQRAHARLRQQLAREPECREIAIELDVTEAEVEKIQRCLVMQTEVEDLYGSSGGEDVFKPLLITDAEKRSLTGECEEESDSEDVGGIDEYVYSAMDLQAFYDDPDDMLCEEIADPYVLTPEENAIVNEMAAELSVLMQERLSARECDILRRRTGMNAEHRDETLEEIADSYGLTRERIRQMEAKALNKLNHPSCARRIEGYLDDLG